MGFLVRYPISMSKHSNRQRGFEVDPWLRTTGGSVTSSFGGSDVDNERPELRE